MPSVQAISPMGTILNMERGGNRVTRLSSLQREAKHPPPPPKRGEHAVWSNTPMSEFLNVGLSNRNAPAGRLEQPEVLDRHEIASLGQPRQRMNDEVAFSDHARLLAMLKSMPDVRADKVEAAKALIASGGYDDADFLSVSLDRMMNDPID